MKKTLLALPLLLALAPNGTAAAAEGAQKPAKARWYVEKSRQRCTLMRETGGSVPATLAFRLVPGSSGIQLTAVDTSWRAPPVKNKETITVSLGEGEPYRKTATPIASRRHHGLIAYFERSLLERVRQSSALVLMSNDKKILEVRLPAAAKALAALETCEDQMLGSWGVGPSVRAALQRLPEPRQPLASLVSDADFPANAPIASGQGLSVVRLAVGTDGKVSQCDVVAGSGFELLDDRTCSIFRKRASFDPALDNAGNPVASFVITHITWWVVP